MGLVGICIFAFPLKEAKCHLFSHADAGGEIHKPLTIVSTINIDNNRLALLDGKEEEG
jgi:hypothetical protein